MTEFQPCELQNRSRSLSPIVLYVGGSVDGSFSPATFLELSCPTPYKQLLPAQKHYYIYTVDRGWHLPPIIVGSCNMLVARWAHYHHCTSASHEATGLKRSQSVTHMWPAHRGQLDTKERDRFCSLRDWNFTRERRSQVWAQLMVLFPTSPFSWAMLSYSLQAFTPLLFLIYFAMCMCRLFSQEPLHLFSNWRSESVMTLVRLFCYSVVISWLLSTYRSMASASQFWLSAKMALKLWSPPVLLL